MASDEGDTLRQAVFGANDGLVSTFGLVAGLTGANASPLILIVANVINMFASGMSMGLGSYISTKSEIEYHRRIAEEERTRIRTDKRAALADVRRIFTRKGVPAREVAAHVRTVTDNEAEWLAFVLAEKHGISEGSFPNPIKGGVVMFFVFVLCGLVPIVPLFFFRGMEALAFSALFTAIALFFVGAMKVKLTGRTWYALGVENLVIGCVTGVVGFLAGLYTAHLMGNVLLV